MTEKIGLVWATKFKELLKEYPDDYETIVNKFLDYILDQEYCINKDFGVKNNE